MTRMNEELKPAMQGYIPSLLGTCSLAGEPNITVVSQVVWVDEEHVALSFQFFNKTIRNVRENPYASVMITHPGTAQCWELSLRYEHSESEGPLFDSMDMQLMAIASMTGMSDVFKLRAADVYFVEAVTPRGRYFEPLTTEP